MNDYWRDYMIDCKFVGIFPGVPPLTLVTNAGHRTDAIPPEGGMSCSSLPFFREQVADKYNYAIGILNPDSTFNLAASPQAEMATNLAYAIMTGKLINGYRRILAFAVLSLLPPKTLLLLHVRLTGSAAIHK